MRTATECPSCSRHPQRLPTLCQEERSEAVPEVIGLGDPVEPGGSTGRMPPILDSLDVPVALCPGSGSRWASRTMSSAPSPGRPAAIRYSLRSCARVERKQPNRSRAAGLVGLDVAELIGSALSLDAQRVLTVTSSAEVLGSLLGGVRRKRSTGAISASRCYFVNGVPGSGSQGPQPLAAFRPPIFGRRHFPGVRDYEEHQELSSNKSAGCEWPHSVPGCRCALGAHQGREDCQGWLRSRLRVAERSTGMSVPCRWFRR